VRHAGFSVRPGAGTVDAGAGRQTAGGAAPEDGFAGLLEGDTVLVLLLLAAFGWGALHALSPGHGKAMVAAYLVGTKGRPRDAFFLGGTVTIAHTAGVFALGFVTLGLSAWILPEDLYPWLTLASGLLVVAVGASVLRRHLRARRHQHAHEHGHEHGHHHHHHHDQRPTRRGLLALGASAGMIPCPSALVVLLGAIAQHEVGLGLLLIVAFSAGLAATLTVLGLLVVWARRLAAPPRLARVLTVAPAVSSVVIIGFGCVLAIRALPTLM
jgi:nickel/cobalt transporter (NicO) family protein